MSVVLKVMSSGGFYSALEELGPLYQKKTGKDPLKMFKQALENVSPQGEGRPVHVYAADNAWQAVLMPIRGTGAQTDFAKDHAAYWQGLAS